MSNIPEEIKNKIAEAAKEKFPMYTGGVREYVIDLNNKQEAKRNSFVSAAEFGYSLSSVQGWVKDKPKFDGEFAFITATWFKDHWEYSEWESIKVESPDGWYYGLCEGDGEEWGDPEDLTADLYYVLPSPPKTKG